MWQGWRRARQRKAVRVGVLIALMLLLLALGLLNLRTGEVSVENGVILKAIGEEIGIRTDLNLEDRLTRRDAQLITQIRLPRLLMAGIVGAALALAGAALQGIFRNPLADPSLIGVSSGAALGAVTLILLHADEVSPVVQPLGAFAGGLLLTLLTYRLAYRRERTDATTLLLVGFAINAIVTAFIGMAGFVASQAEVGDILFWTLGTTAGTFWQDLRIVLMLTLPGVLLLPLLAKSLNLMALGEREARHLGVNVERLRLGVISLAALMVGAVTGFVGMVGFVGLLVPHLLRLLLGPDHRVLLPASVIGGAAFLLGFDLLARSIASPLEIPLGLLTTLAGGPFFLALILFSRRGP